MLEMQTSCQLSRCEKRDAWELRRERTTSKSKARFQTFARVKGDTTWPAKCTVAPYGIYPDARSLGHEALVHRWPLDSSKVKANAGWLRRRPFPLDQHRMHRSR